ncbi:MAG: hypothetical protein QOH12_991 [Solirubrobacteraceae bacterium]|jgi:hypothetical protein|nr:hypothetical protein [Solirubrobacteraceae bacterium]
MVGGGSELLIHALSTIVVAARAADGRIIIVGAIDEAAAGFYGCHDSREVPVLPSGCR